jgi:hypothetical protein
MPRRGLTGSDHPIRPPAAIRPPSAMAVRGNVHAHMAASVQAHRGREQNWSAGYERNRHEAATGSRDNGVADGRARRGRPQFARLHASIAERQLDWAWHNSPDTAKASAERERAEAKSADTGPSARASWLGGIAFALLAGGIIAAVATIQSSRPLPFETWARDDLMQRADGVPGRMPTNGTAAALIVAPTAADGQRGEVDAALGSHARLQPSDIDIAGLGPILATAAVAERLAADPPSPHGWVSTAGVETRAGPLLPEPPRPVFKPAPTSPSER